MANSKTDVLINELHKLYPKTKHYLNFSNTLELLVATILSAQVRDEMVNTATPALFAKYKTPRDYARASLEDIQKLVARIPFFRNKSKNIQEACKVIDEKYKGEIPSTMEELIELPGIGRKSANVVLSNGMDIIVGITVDTHVIRLSQRMGFSKHKDPEKIEQDLMKLVPKKFWILLPRWMKELGRSHCRGPKPKCAECPVQKLCPKIGL